MKKYSIGYRLKFDDINQEKIEDFINLYQKQFDRFEIKVTRNLIFSGKIELVLSVSEKMAVGRYSIHVLKDVLKKPEEYSIMVELIEVLRKVKISKQVNLVTHIPYENLSNFLWRVLKISMLLPENYIFLLENIVLDNGNEEYLKQIDDICFFLEVNNIENIGICLDIGHLLFGCNSENISDVTVLSKLQEMPHVLSRIKEIHIHDYLEQDHLQLKSGSMNLNLVSDFIKRNEFNVPIIIESTVKIPNKDGVEQIKIMEELLSKS